MAARAFVPGAVALATALATLPLAGCATQEPQPVYYPPPPPPRALTITAQRKQSQQQQDRDKADCQEMASGQATSSDTWAQIFTACMGGRGYMVR
ncbi:MAG: hypothetical protein KIT14_01015 [bacterium]|nr:hypothetical protein [bacterium]